MAADIADGTGPTALLELLALTSRIALVGIAIAIVLIPWLLWQIAAIRRSASLAVLQILAGILLGPSVFGRLLPAVHRAVFTPDVLAQLSGLATVGVLLYVLAAGLHLDSAGLRGGARRLLAPTLGSILLPLMFGAAAGWWMLRHVPGASGRSGSAASLIACVAICTSVTALPVLAAMLREMGLIGTRLGQTALAIAALNDTALWLMIAVLLALAKGSPGHAAITLAAAFAWFAVMLRGVGPGLACLARRLPPEAMLGAVLAAALGSALTTDSIGIGGITGAFVAGAVVPVGLRAPLTGLIEPLTAAILLPFFFAITGLRAFVDPGSGMFVGILVVATAATLVGKVAGTALPARRSGTPWREALALGSLMQTKGLMEVLVLAVMADAGLIGPAVFSALVAMAVLCTVIAPPLTRFCLGRKEAVLF